MNRLQLHQVLEMLPEGAGEIIIKGRTTTTVFFTMPEDWAPAEDSPFAKAATSTVYNGNRWQLQIDGSVEGAEADSEVGEGEGEGESIAGVSTVSV